MSVSEPLFDNDPVWKLCINKTDTGNGYHWWAEFEHYRLHALRTVETEDLCFEDFSKIAYTYHIKWERK